VNQQTPLVITAQTIPAAEGMKVHFSQKSNEWATPQDVFDKLDSMFGPFSLDPCATPENAKCERFFTAKEDGIKQDWGTHTVFMNPPYGRQIGRWIAKAYHESLQGAMVVCLIPARTDTAYWHDYVMRAGEVYLLRGRIKFVGSNSSAPFPSCVVVFYPRDHDQSPLFFSLDSRAERWERYHEDDIHE
jgi:site-specific DNA-methyltransferase (adenine-specific)